MMTIIPILMLTLDDSEPAEKWYYTSTCLFNTAEYLYHERFILNKAAIQV